jgi:hypothetical protein
MQESPPTPFITFDSNSSLRKAAPSSSPSQQQGCRWSSILNRGHNKIVMIRASYIREYTVTLCSQAMPRITVVKDELIPPHPGPETCQLPIQQWLVFCDSVCLMCKTAGCFCQSTFVAISIILYKSDTLFR